METSGSTEPCRNGVHACRVDHLPTWIDEELWSIELDGEVAELRSLLVARRGRLVERVDGWGRSASQEFAQACAERAQRYGGPLAADAAASAAEAHSARAVAFTAYAAAHAAEAAGAGGFQAERGRQARWLQDRLGLDG